jgi:long-chain acyl-CoA synthetase
MDMVFEGLMQHLLRHIKEKPESRAIQYYELRKLKSLSYHEFGEKVAALSAWLSNQGIKKGDRVAIIGENCMPWAVADCSISFIGAISVAIYPTLTPADYKYILNNSDSTIVFVQNSLLLDKIRTVLKDLPFIKHIVTFERLDTGDLPAVCMEDIASACDINDLERRTVPVLRDDPICIIYTSGTTGPPKGVVLTHGNIISVIESILSMLKDHTIIQLNLSFLPLSHALERIAGFYLTLYLGNTIAFAESLETIVINMKEIKPTHAISVPRVFEKVFEKVAATAAAGGPVKKKIFWWSVGVGSRASRKISTGRGLGPLLSIQYGIARALVFSKLAEAMGGNLKYFISGGAPLSARIAEFFHAAGILVLEGWGATETSAPATFNRPDLYRFGSVGIPIPGVEVRVEDDGELLVRGPTVFKEYWKLDAATREAKDTDGWYHTGDIGIIDDTGFVYITDRKKELIITAAGKNISPANIENLIKSSPFISYVMAFGDRKKFITALITLEPNNVKSYLEKMKIAVPDERNLHLMPEVRSLIEKEINTLNNQLARFEQIKKFTIIDRDFSIEDDLLTPTMKLKRKNIVARYVNIIESMYEDDVVKNLEMG